jgi:hypothetical protein
VKPFRKSFFATRSNYHLIAASLPYCIIVSFLFFVSFTPHLLKSDDIVSLLRWVGTSLFQSGSVSHTDGNLLTVYAEHAPFTFLFGNSTSACGGVSGLFSVVTFSFLGSYIFTLRAGSGNLHSGDKWIFRLNAGHNGREQERL